MKRVKVFLYVVAIACFLIFLGLTGSCENDLMTLGEYVPGAVISVVGMVSCIYVVNRIEKEDK